MSTQRRENRWQRNWTECTTKLGHIWLIFVGWFVRAAATVGTAPPHASLSLRSERFHPSDEDLSPGAPARLATNSLQSGHLFTQLVPPVEQDIRRGPPPFGDAVRTVGPRSSFPLTPTPSVLDTSYPSLPNHPAGKCRWTERYDGKRDLHFLNAA